MNLARHATVLWRFRRVTLVGVFLAIVLAILASYRVSSSGLTARGSETWTSISSVLVTQPGFPEGRVVLPTKEIDDALSTDNGTATGDSTAKEKVEFADPGRLAALGDLYARFMTSDQVLANVPEHPSRAQVQASPFAASQGGLLLPVVQLTTMAQTGPAAQNMNVHVFKALQEFMTNRQGANDIPPGKRVQIRLLDSPQTAMTSGPKPTASVLAFILIMLGTVAVTHLLEALRNRRQSEALAAMVPWDPPHPQIQDFSEDEPRIREAISGYRASRDD
jgi:hypothetical protein